MWLGCASVPGMSLDAGRPGEVRRKRRCRYETTAVAAAMALAAVNPGAVTATNTAPFG